jgi:uncharacterized membrane protein YcaP (DUF421 family)
MIHDLFASGIPLAEKAIRSVAVYLFLLGVLRLAGKREIAQLNNFDFVVLLLLSNTVQNAIIGSDDSLWGGLFGAAVLVAANRLVVQASYRSQRLTNLVQGRQTVLVRGGRALRRNLRRELITSEELMAAVRRQGVSRLRDVRLAVLEPTGALTVEPEDVIGEVLARLRRIEAHLGSDGGPPPPSRQ